MPKEMICVVQNKDSEFMIQLPHSNLKMISMQELSSNPITDKTKIYNTYDIITGNVYKKGNKYYAPRCITLAYSSISDNFTKVTQCDTLNSAKPNEFKKKWINLGCPYSIRVDDIKRYGISNLNELKSFRKPSLPNYHPTIDKNIKNNVPMIRTEYEKKIKIMEG